MKQEMIDDVVKVYSSPKYVNKIHCTIEGERLIIRQGSINHIEFENIASQLKDDLSPVSHKYGLRTCGDGGRMHLNDEGTFVLVFPQKGIRPIPVYPNYNRP